MLVNEDITGKPSNRRFRWDNLAQRSATRCATFSEITQKLLGYQYCLMAIRVLASHAKMEIRDHLQHPDATDWLELPEGSTLLGLLLSAFGAVAGALRVCNWQSLDPLRYRILLAVAAICSGPWIASAKSRMLMLVAVLYGMGHLSDSETILVGAIGILLSAFWDYGLNRRGIEQSLFKTGLMTLGIVAAEQVFHSSWLHTFGVDGTVRFVFASIALFLVNTVPVALLYSKRDGQPFVMVWERRHLVLFPYYMASALLAQILALA